MASFPSVRALKALGGVWAGSRVAGNRPVLFFRRKVWWLVFRAVVGGVAALVLVFAPTVPASAAAVVSAAPVGTAAVVSPAAAGDLPSWADNWAFWASQAGESTSKKFHAWLKKVERDYPLAEVDPAQWRGVTSFGRAQSLKAPGYWLDGKTWVSIEEFAKATTQLAKDKIQAKGNFYPVSKLADQMQLSAPYDVLTEGATTTAAKAARVQNGRTTAGVLTALKEAVGDSKAAGYLRILQDIGWVRGGVLVLGTALNAWGAYDIGSVVGNGFASVFIGGDADSKTCALDWGNDFFNGIKNFLAHADCGEWEATVGSPNADISELPGDISYGGFSISVKSYVKGAVRGVCVTTSPVPNTTGLFYKTPQGYTGQWDGRNSDSCVAVGLTGMLLPLDQVPMSIVDGAGNVLVSQAPPDPDPDRESQVCTTTAGVELCGVASAPWKESGNIASPPATSTGSGTTVPDKTCVKETNKQTGASKSVSCVETSQKVKDWASQYPECVNGTCKLDLLDKRTGVSCFDEKTICANWWKETGRNSKYKCDYAGHDLGLSKCEVYKNSFKPKNQSTGDTITDPGDTASAGDDPDPNDGDDPGDDDDGGSLGQVDPGTGDQSPSDACWSDGWAEAANPLDWVLTPVKCALVWAFVPDGWAFEQAVSDAQLELGESAPMVQVADVIDDVTPHVTASGCEGMPIDLSLGDTEIHQTLLASCTGPLAPARVAVNIIAAAMMVITTVVACLRHIAAVFDYQSPVAAQTAVYSEGDL